MGYRYMSISNMPSVFISYNWGSEQTASELESRLEGIAEIFRDRNSLGSWGSLTEFMKRIRDTDFVVIIVSDDYLKSIACLYEVMQLLKDDEWLSHTMFLVEDSAKGIYKSTGQLDYVKYWKDQRDSLEKAIEDMDPALVTAQSEDLKKIALIQLNINDFMKTVADCNNPELGSAITAVKQRVLSTIGNSRDSYTKNARSIHPVFDVKVKDKDKQLPGTAVVVDINHGKPFPKHKNVQYQVELINDVLIRNLKVFGRSVEPGIIKKDKPYYLSVCYMESPDRQWPKSVLELSRDIYPAGVDGIPKIVVLEYSLDKTFYLQRFHLVDGLAYEADEPEVIVTKDIEKTIQMKKRMRDDFLKPNSKLRSYSREDLWNHPGKKFISDEVIIMSTECKDAKWNTEGGYGKYEVYDFCDEGLLCWDSTGFRAEVRYYCCSDLFTTIANRMLCLPFEAVVAYDLAGNSGYNMPIIYADYQIGSSPFKYYYRDCGTGSIIDNGVLAEVSQAPS